MKEFWGRGTPVESRAIREDPDNGHMECKVLEWRLPGPRPGFHCALDCPCLTRTESDSEELLGRVTCSKCNRTYDVVRDEPIKNGKWQIAAQLREAAEKLGMKLNGITWFAASDLTFKLVAQNPETGREDEAEFALPHVLFLEMDNQIKVQTQAKLTGLLIKLGKQVGQF